MRYWPTDMATYIALQTAAGRVVEVQSSSRGRGKTVDAYDVIGEISRM